jgi:hypothetical protein
MESPFLSFGIHCYSLSYLTGGRNQTDKFFIKPPAMRFDIKFLSHAHLFVLRRAHWHLGVCWVFSAKFCREIHLFSNLCIPNSIADVCREHAMLQFFMN